MTPPAKRGRPTDAPTTSRAYRLTRETIGQVERLAAELGVSHAQVIARAVAALAGGETARDRMVRAAALHEAAAAIRGLTGSGLDVGLDQ